MRMNIVIAILGFLVEGDTTQIDVLLVLGKLLVLARQTEFCKGTGWILRLHTLLEELHLIGLGLFLAEINQETEFIVGTITVGVVELRRNLLTVNGYHGTLNITNSSQLTEVNNHRSIGLSRLGRIGYRHFKIRLCLD